MKFDPEQWVAKLGDLGPDASNNFFGPRIVGPTDALLAIKLRKLVQEKINWGEAIPLDIFLLAQGESSTRKQTKIGGLPYWDRQQAWPCTSAGAAKPFLAQFDFSESKDVCDDVPADVLLLFGHPEAEEGLTLAWQKEISPERLIVSAELPTQSLTPSYYGNRWRTMSYPNWEPKDNESWCTLELPDGTTVHNLFFVIDLLGVGIGSAPFIPRSLNFLSSGEKILCCLPTISPNIDIPYPLVNHAEPIPGEMLHRYALHVSEVLDEDSFGLLYIYRTADGTFNWHLDGL